MVSERHQAVALLACEVLLLSPTLIWICLAALGVVVESARIEVGEIDGDEQRQSSGELLDELDASVTGPAGEQLLTVLSHSRLVGADPSK